MKNKIEYVFIICLILLVIISSGCIEQNSTPITTEQVKETMQTPLVTTHPPRTTEAAKTTQPEEKKDEPEKQAKTLTTGTVAIYFSQTLGSISENLKGQYVNPTTGEGGGFQIDWSKTGYGVFRYVPEHDELTLAKTTISPSYAKHTIKPITTGGRLFLASEYSTQIALDERNPLDNNPIRNFAVQASDVSTYTIRGDTVYYRTSRDCFGTSCRGGALKVYDINTLKSTQILPYGHQDNFGTMFSAGGNLYTTYDLRYRAPYDQEGWVIHRRDPETFEILETVADYTDLTNYDIKDFAFDQNGIYVEAYNKGVFELWKQDYNGVNPIVLYTNADDGEVLSGTTDRVLTIDVDDGYVLLNFYKGKTVIYSEKTNTVEKYDLGLGMRRNVQILKIR